MAFFARNFVFDGIPSETYGLIISSSDSGEGTSNASADVELVTQKIFRRPKPYFYGTTLENVLEFEAEISTSETELTGVDSALVQKWLFGQMNYKKLRVVQPDMEDIYFNCFLKNPQVKRVGNIIRGYTFTVVCDSPYAWGNPKTVTYKTSNKTYILYNESENLFYTYPLLTVRMNGTAGGHFHLTNVTDNNRNFSMEGLSPSEVITIDNDLQIVTSTLNTLILNKITPPVTFFRLLSGKNELFLDGNINTSTGVTITYTPMKRMA